MHLIYIELLPSPINLGKSMQSTNLFSSLGTLLAFIPFEQTTKTTQQTAVECTVISSKHTSGIRRTNPEFSNYECNKSCTEARGRWPIGKRKEEAANACGMKLARRSITPNPAPRTNGGVRRSLHTAAFICVGVVPRDRSFDTSIVSIL